MKKEYGIENQYRYPIFFGFGLISILIGYILTPSLTNLFKALLMQQSATNLLDSNLLYLVKDVGLGAPFVNAGILFLLVLFSYFFAKVELNGASIPAAFMVFGFGFCGKNLWNIWPLLFGVIGFGLQKKKQLSKLLPLAWFSTALSPMVSILTLYTQYDGSNVLSLEPHFSISSFCLASAAGLFAGYCILTLADLLPKKHEGLTVYNAGMAAGLTGFLAFSLMKAMGIAHGAPSHEYPSFENGTLVICIIVLLAYLLVCGIVVSHKEKEGIIGPIKELYLGNAVEQYGFGATLINMALCGFLCLLYWFLTIKAAVHSPLFASLFTVVGFASNGISIKSMLPILCGVYCTSFFAGIMQGDNHSLINGLEYVSSKSMLIAALFGCGMAPVVYHYGYVVAFFAAMVHSLLVVNTGILHGWMNLYNNGFCIGLVVTFFVPILVKIVHKENH